jgi:hypothetical protein
MVEDRFDDTTKILIAELPVRFDSTDILLFAINLVDLDERAGYSKFGSESKSTQTSTYFNSEKLTGNFVNFVFKDKTGEEKKLTEKKIRIRSISFLREMFKRTKQGYLLYTVTDRDSNDDKELDHSDLEALYISRIDGSDFKKLTRELHEFYDWTFLNGDSKIYFRTLEDGNQDGTLNNKDKFHYYFIDLSIGNYSVTEYNPVKIFSAANDFAN